MGHEHRQQTVAASPALCGIAAARVMAAVAIWLAVWLPSLSQTLRGRVVDDMGNAVANASLYIGRLRQGFVADGDGRFAAVVPCGGYECRVSSLGYGTVTVPVTVDADTVTLDIVLHRMAYALTEVQVTGGGEDPALGIMRHVVARAPYNAVLPDTFVVETFVKGRGKFKRVPKLISLAASSDTMTRRLINSLFVMERVSRIEYKSPGHISEHVLAFTSTFPDALKGYQVDRIMALLYPDQYPDIARQQLGGMTAIGSGQIFGRGFFSDDHYSVINAQDDFMFSYLAECIGFVGCVIVLGALFFIAIRTLTTGLRSEDHIGTYICTGVFAAIAWQIIINLGMNLSLLPVIGVTLPFFSAGGTSALMMYLCVGLVMSVYMHNKQKLFSD